MNDNTEYLKSKPGKHTNICIIQAMPHTLEQLFKYF